MRIWIDADVAPKDVREIVARASERLGIETRLVPHQAIVASADPGDLAITRGRSAASELVPRGLVALDIRGDEHDLDPVGGDGDPEVRELLADLRSIGGSGSGPPPYDERAKRDFAAALDRVLARMRRSA